MTNQNKVPFNKPPKTFSEQVKILKSHGLVIQDTNKAEFYLSQLNYYRLAAYCIPFEIDHDAHRITEGTTFDDVLNLYTFDRELRLLLIDAIERIEVSLRTQMAYQLSHSHNTSHPHLVSDIFKDDRKHQSGLKKLKHEVTQSDEDFICHLRTKYKEDLPPIWAVVELMTMGQLSKWFSNINQRCDRIAISQAYSLNETIMTSFCEHLSLVRNKAAHHARLWNRVFSKQMKLPKNGPSDLINSLLNLPNEDKNLKKLYNTLTIILYIMNIISPEHHWKSRIKDLIRTHAIDTTKMGFPLDWETRPLWT